MRKIYCFLILVIILLTLGCTAAKKPELQPEPKTIVVPDVSKITFETMDFAKAPEIVQALAKNLDDKHFATWTAVNGRNYVIVSQQNLPAGNSVKISEIERRVPANDFDWINVKLLYSINMPTTPAGGKSDSEKPLVAAFTIDRAVKAVGFQIEKETSKTQPPATPPPATTSSKEQTKAVERGLKLDSPKPGEQVKGPMQVSGTAMGVEGTVRVRLKDSGGLTLAEKPVQLTNGKFSTTISFSLPANPEKATVEAFVTGGDGVEKDTVSVPITIMPSTTSEPETLGAP